MVMAVLVGMVVIPRVLAGLFGNGTVVLVVLCQVRALTGARGGGFSSDRRNLSNESNQHCQFRV